MSQRWGLSSLMESPPAWTGISRMSSPDSWLQAVVSFFEASISAFSAAKLPAGVSQLSSHVDTSSISSILLLPVQFARGRPIGMSQSSSHDDSSSTSKYWYPS
eukprot:CAMPEP_0204392526 /NCGR_PEP_ID=MMETSP0469-20131031/61804_1 /ASSEMBLY_ACC=CAM_ASM_000384 /TAXON_ID=2969 /ORGANISM="Oxyrrhis marina" /LENGTH=102 /DNA_ID=CAMNT_0051386505 /DNA_START=230 /DNA_END=538 /DNA_ORIENTATION=+